MTDGARHSGDTKIGQRLINIALGAIACLIAAGVLSQWGTQQAIKSTVNRFMEALIAGDADVVQSLLTTSVTEADRERLVPTPATQATIISIVDDHAQGTRVRLRLEFPNFRMYSNLTLRQDRQSQWRIDPHILNWWLAQRSLTDATHSVMKRVVTTFDKSTLELATSNAHAAGSGYSVMDMRIEDSNQVGWVTIAMKTQGKQLEIPLVFQLHNHQWYLIKIENTDETPVLLQRALAETRAHYDGERLVDELQEALRVQKIDGTEVQRLSPAPTQSVATPETPNEVVPARP
ncbi:MAG: hypothetical protein ABGZ17_11030 [Planctomycetaceae bacterium]